MSNSDMFTVVGSFWYDPDTDTMYQTEHSTIPHTPEQETPTMSTVYMSKREFTQAKSRLTRAINSREPRRVLGEVATTIHDWNAKGYAWPDDWARWQRAYDDAFYQAHRSGDSPTYDHGLFR